jgi:hypothetical protein
MKGKAILLACLCWLAWGQAAQGAAVREMNLEQLCSHAATIFWGRCTAVQDDGAELVYTFRPHRFLKGGPSDAVTLRMHRMAALYAQAPRFAQGQEVVLFLYPESRKGYSSPVGFGQGVFDVADGGGAAKTVVNGRGNRGLFKGMDLQARFAGPAFTGLKQAGPHPGALGHEPFMNAVARTVERQARP